MKKQTVLGAIMLALCLAATSASVYAQETQEAQTTQTQPQTQPQPQTQATSKSMTARAVELKTPAFGHWNPQKSNTTASLGGLSIVNTNVVWASGTGGTFVRTTDGGETWQAGTVPGGEKLDFRDIYAVDAKTAYLMSIGNGNTIVEFFSVAISVSVCR